jgi:hypothetical protein
MELIWQIIFYYKGTMNISERRNFIKQSIGFALSLPALLSFKTNYQEGTYPKILFRMGWNNNDNNDLALIPAIYRLAQKAILKTEFYLWLGESDEKLMEMLNKNFTSLKLVTGEIDESGQPSTDELKNALSESDLFFYTPGSATHIDWSGLDNTGIETRSLQYCLDNSITYALMGLGELPEDKESLDRLVKIANGAEFVYSTSSTIDKLMKDKNIKIPKIQTLPNPLFGFDLRDDSQSRKVLQGYYLLDKDFLTVDFKVQGISDEKLSEYSRKVINLISSWVKETDKNVLLLPNHDADVEYTIKNIYDLLPDEIKSKVAISKERLMPDLAASIYEKSRIVCGMSLFPACSTIRSGNPVMFLTPADVSARAKTIEDMGLKNSIQDLDSRSEEELSEVLLEIDEKYLNGIIESDKAREYATKKLMDHFDDINRFVNKMADKKENEKKKEKKKKEKES